MVHSALAQKSTVFALKIRDDSRNQFFPRFAEEHAMPEVHAFPSIPTKILLPIDFSLSSQAALEMTADLAKHIHAELYLVHVIPVFPTSTLPDFVPETKFLQDVRSVAERHLAKCHAVLAARGVKSNSSVEVGNDIAGNIMEVVEREHIDMVVISTHGISGWHPLVFGSIAEKVVKLVQCPLLLLRSANPGDHTKTQSEHPGEWW
jgi:nucleotide-binding universal stress UspA family protein